MFTQTKSQIVGSFIAAIFVCFLVIGVVVAAFCSEQKAAFNPLPYALGNVYDADMLIDHVRQHAHHDMAANNHQS